MRQRANTKNVVSIVIILIVMVGLPTTGFGDVPHQINYQGTLTDNLGNSLDGDYAMTFAIYDVDTGGSSIWSETQTVTVADGVYNVILGRPGKAFDPADMDGELFLGVSVDNWVNETGDTMSDRLTISNSSTDGVWAYSPSDDGLFVNLAGDDGIEIDSPSDDGIEVDSAGDDGVYITDPTNDGVVVDYAGDDGLHVYYPAGDGVYVYSAGSYGVNATGATGAYFSDKDSGTYAYIAYGSFGIFSNGTKNFIEAHPTDPEKVIVYSSLEGGEAGTYYRGSAQLTDGTAVVELPEHFRLVTEEAGLVVQVTPRADCNGLYVAAVTTASIVVKELQQGSSNARFDFLINGIRTGYLDYKAINTKSEIGLDTLEAEQVEQEMALAAEREAQAVERQHGKERRP